MRRWASIATDMTRITRDGLIDLLTFSVSGQPISSYAPGTRLASSVFAALSLTAAHPTLHNFR
jgi:ABC-type enterochelin transport system substrate-binding protein